MASLTDNLKIVNLALGEEGYGAFTDYGAVQDDNWRIVEDALTAKSDITIDTANVTLTDAQQVSLYLNLSGTLTGNRDIILKATQKGFWLVNNGTSGAFTVTIKPASGTGFSLPQGYKTLVFSDGSTAISVLTSYNAFGPSDIGVLIQAYSDILAALAGVTGAANKLAYFTGATTMAVADLSAFARTLIDDASASAALDTLGVPMRFVETKTLSGASEAAFTTGFSSDYDEYIFQFIGVRAGTDDATLICDMSENAGSSYLTGYDYQMTYSHASTSTNIGGDGGVSGVELVRNVDTLAASSVFGKVSVLISTTKAGLVGEFNSRDSAGANTRTSKASGGVPSSSRINGVRFRCSPGTMTGVIRMFAIKNA